uniref:G protein-coupled receptor 101 n=1 Tax=Loxodonta africana TaxID=9785 RepID=G3TWL7_LOXAF
MTSNCTNSTDTHNSSSHACVPLSKMPISLAHGIIRSTVLIILLVVALVGNLVLGIVLQRKPQLLQVANRFIFNLLVTDLLQVLLVAPWVVAISVPFLWPLNNHFCTALVSLTHLFAFASVNTIVVVSIDRYLSIIHPLTYPARMTLSKGYKLIYGTWIMAILQSIPPFYGWGKAAFDERNALCSMLWGDSPSYTTLSVVSFIIIPLMVMIICYAVVFSAARRQHALLYNSIKADEAVQRSTTAALTWGVHFNEDDIEAWNIPESLPPSRRNSGDLSLPRCYECKAAKVIFLIIFSYMLSLGPYCFLAVLAIWVDVQTRVPQWVITIIIWLFFLQCCIHPYVYGYMHRTIRKEIQDMLR